MKRRDFIKKAGITTAATVALPYILPSGRLFAATGARKANHVVFCLFAGGVRNFESIQKSEGNLMPYTINGNESISPDIISGMTSLPANTGSSLQANGTLFKEFRYGQGPTGHINAHTTALTGVYSTGDIALREPPKYPTVFEYYRKHNTPNMSALNSWWVSDQLGAYPFLNFSTYDGYGALYGANMLQPSSMFSVPSFNSIANPQVFDPDELSHASTLKNFFNNQFDLSFEQIASMTNTTEDSAKLQTWILNMLSEAQSGAHTNPWGIGAGAMNNDMYNLFYAGKLIEEFKPELMVVNMTGIDVCHTNFTQYCNNIRRADYALGQLWDKIQSTPGMANDTVLIVSPEHGRNLNPNTIIDQYGRYALDHTSDEISRQLFCLVAGPSGIVKQNNVINTEEGETIDIIPTIADILGFKDEIPGGLLPGQVLNKAFV